MFTFDIQSKLKSLINDNSKYGPPNLQKKKAALLLTKIDVLVNTKVTGRLTYLNLILIMKEKSGLISLIGEKMNLKTARHNVIHSVPARFGGNMAPETPSATTSLARLTTPLRFGGNMAPEPASART